VVRFSEAKETVQSYHQSSYGYIFAAKHPESPRSHPSIAFLSSRRKDFILEDLAQYRAVVALINASHGNSKL
jgi:hypothetical protein